MRNKSVVVVLLAIVVFAVACGPSVRDRAFERQAIWKQIPGAPLKPLGDGVYYVTDPSGKVRQMIVDERKVVGDSCAEKCSEERPKEPRKKAVAMEGDAGY